MTVGASLKEAFFEEANLKERKKEAVFSLTAFGNAHLKNESGTMRADIVFSNQQLGTMLRSSFLADVSNREALFFGAD